MGKKASKKTTKKAGKKLATPVLGPERRADRLVKLAEGEFGDSLRDSERAMLRGASFGSRVDLAASGDSRELWHPPFLRDSSIGPWVNWGDHRRIDGCVIRWLCTSRHAQKLVASRGLNLESALIDGELDLYGAVVPFPIRLRACAIEERLKCGDADLRDLDLQGSTCAGISGHGVRVRGELWLKNNFRSVGEVWLCAARIGGNFDCTHGTFENRDGLALIADMARILGHVYIDGNFQATGAVQFCGTTIGGDLSCTGATFENEGHDALSVQRTQIGGTLFFRCIAWCSGRVDATATSVGWLIDDPESWPDELRLEGFMYDSILHSCLGDRESRRAWLVKHDTTTDGGQFDPQPYRQLADVLRRQGHKYFANEIMFTAAQKQVPVTLAEYREALHKRFGHLKWFEPLAGVITGRALRAWYWLLRVLIGHGYRRWLPPFWLVGFWLLGAVMFSGPSWRGVVGPADPTPAVMQPTQGLAVRAMDDRLSPDSSDEAKTAREAAAWIEEYPAFRPLAYSADAFLPLVNLHQETYWTPKHWFVKSVYLPFHIISGWVVTTLAAVSFTGLVRQEGK